jgi:tetratricopeptide (TPR) repeat protein
LHFQRHQYPEAREWYLRSAALCRQLDDASGEGRDLIGLGAVAFELQEYAEAVHCSEEALRLLRRNADRADEATTLTNLGIGLNMIGRSDEAMKCLTDAQAIAVELDLRHLYQRAAGAIALGRSWRGELEQAATEFERVLAQWVELGYTRGRSETLRNLAEVHLEAGRTDWAIALAGQALTLAEGLEAPWMVMGARVTLGESYLRLGDVAAAQRHLSAALGLTVAGRGFWYPFVLLGLAACHRRRGEHDAAAELALAATGDPRPHLRGRAHAELALTALDRTDSAGTVTHAELARDIADEAGYRLDAARARQILLRAIRSPVDRGEPWKNWSSALP